MRVPLVMACLVVACGRTPLAAEGELGPVADSASDALIASDAVVLDVVATDVREDAHVQLADAAPSRIPLRSVVAAPGYACIVRDDGGVWCWGGRVPGIACGAACSTPTPVPGLEGVVELAAIDTMICARLTSGRVTCRGEIDGRPAPIDVRELAGSEHLVIVGRACGIVSGVVRCEALEGVREFLADAPRVVSHVIPGRAFTCTRVTSGELRCKSRAPEDRTWIDLASSAWTTVADNVADAATSMFTICFVDAASQVRCVGSDAFGELAGAGPDTCPRGDGYWGDGRCARKAVLVPGVSLASRVEMSGYLDGLGPGTMYEWGIHACVLATDQTVTCWGGGPCAFGHGFGIAERCGRVIGAPKMVPGLGSVRDFAVGPSFACALRSDETVWCWGAGPAVPGWRTGDAVVAVPRSVAMPD